MAEPTPPDLGNISNAAFLALPDWSVIATNLAGKADTFTSLETCIVAIFYRLVRDNFEYLNEALACRIDTPLSLAAKSGEGVVHWTPTDWPAVGLTLANMTGANPAPGILFSCNGTNLDDVGGLTLSDNIAGELLTYAVVSAQGSLGSSPDYPFVFGLRTHATRYVHAEDTAIAKAQDIAYQATYSLPEWPQDSEANIVLAKVADFTSATDTGPSNRIGFEFGLGSAPSGPPGVGPRDYAPYVRWYDSGDVEQKIEASLPTSGPVTFSPGNIAITPGRRVTLGFHRYFNGVNWSVIFLVNGRAVTTQVGTLAAPDIAAGANIRLHIGSAQLGVSYTGGPVNNVMVWANPSDHASVAASMLTAYSRGEGFEAVP